MKKADPQLLEISKKIDILVRLSAINATKDLKFKQQVAILSDAGFRPRQIADMLGTTANNVSVTLHGIRKERGAKESGEGSSFEAPTESKDILNVKEEEESVEKA
jgi:hypothetical protein